MRMAVSLPLCRMNLILRDVKDLSMKRILQAGSVMILLFLLLFFSGVQAQENRAEGRKEFVLNIVGDIMLSRDVQRVLNENGYDYPYEEVSYYFLEDDLTIGNLECPITKAGNAANKEKRFIFRADYENAGALFRAGFNCLNLANNHTMDYLDEGLGDTMEALREEGISTVGAGKSGEEDITFIWEKDGYKIGILAFSALPTEGFFYDAKAPTVSYISTYNTDLVAEKIRSLECDFKIVYFHWGIEYMPYKTKTQESFAHMAVDNGADLVVGAHPHVIGESEMYAGVPIYYSLGNFVFDRQIQPGTDETMILQVVIDRETGIREIKEIPGKIVDARVHLIK